MLSTSDLSGFHYFFFSSYLHLQRMISQKAVVAARCSCVNVNQQGKKNSKERKEKNMQFLRIMIFICQARLTLLRAVAGLICRGRLDDRFLVFFFHLPVSTL